MDVKLENLIEKIKQEGIEEAEKQREAVLTEAGKKAEKILAEAKAQAEDMRNKAERDSAQFRQTAEAALAQASRDLVLKVREQLTFICDNLLRSQVREALSPEIVKEMLVKIAEKWDLQQGLSLEAVLSPEDRDRVKELVLSSLQEKAGQSLEFSVSPEIEKGFRINRKDENIYYDFSDESIVDSLKELVNPVLGEILNKDNG